MNKESACNICGRVVEECDPEETKALFLITKIEKLKNIYDDKLRGNVFSQNPSFGAAKFKLKVLLFSQFPEILETVGYRLVKKFCGGCVTLFWGAYKLASLRQFTNDDECVVMLLKKDGSHGLDLSFVSHIFFLDEILDLSLKEQIIARAYRLGSKNSVQCEQLIARGSVEENIHELNNNKNRVGGANKKDGELKILNLLKELKIVRREQSTTNQSKQNDDDDDDNDDDNDDGRESSNNKTTRTRVRFDAS